MCLLLSADFFQKFLSVSNGLDPDIWTDILWLSADNENRCCSKERVNCLSATVFANSLDPDQAL